MVLLVFSPVGPRTVFVHVNAVAPASAGWLLHVVCSMCVQGPGVDVLAGRGHHTWEVQVVRLSEVLCDGAACQFMPVAGSRALHGGSPSHDLCPGAAPACCVVFPALWMDAAVEGGAAWSRVLLPALAWSCPVLWARPSALPGAAAVPSPPRWD